jgi:hypothetical protein
MPTSLLLGAAALSAPASELTNTMKELGDLLTGDEIAQFVKLMDTDNDGVVGVSAASRLHSATVSLFMLALLLTLLRIMSAA